MTTKYIALIGCLSLLLLSGAATTGISDTSIIRNAQPSCLSENNSSPSLSIHITCCWAIPHSQFAFTASVSDPENDEVWIYVLWGDGAYQAFGPYTTSEDHILTHEYEKEGNYSIKVYATDWYHMNEGHNHCGTAAWIRDCHFGRIRCPGDLGVVLYNDGDYTIQVPYEVSITHLRTNETVYLGLDILMVDPHDSQSIYHNLPHIRQGFVKITIYNTYFGLEATKYGLHFGRCILIFQSPLLSK
jgi:hypothetical protein